MAPVRQGIFGTLLDRVVGWKSSLPAETTNYTVESFRIPVGDKVHLAADLYRPLQPTKPKGTVLIRTPYGTGIVMAIAHARPLAARGYQVLLSSCRGTNDSEGELDPGRNEAADGQAVVKWMRDQAWYTGSFAALGASYIGYVQWTLLSENPPPDFIAAAIYTGPHDMSQFIWGTGALDSSVFSWADFATRQKRGDNQLSIMLALRSQQAELKPVFDALPLLRATDKHYRERFTSEMPPWLHKTLTNPDITDEYWKPLQHGSALQKTNLPIFLTAGWYDLILPQVMEQYYTLSQQNSNVALTIGPWSHLEAGTGFNVLSETYDWFEQHVAKSTAPSPRKSPVRVYVTGTNSWVNLPKWPPPPTPHTLFLSPNSSLSPAKPTSISPLNSPAPDSPSSSSTFTFSPLNPTPFTGTSPLFDRGGTTPSQRKPNTVLASRDDVISFTTDPLPHDLQVCGKPVVYLYHASDTPFVDLHVTLSEVDGAGESRGVSERYLRLGGYGDKRGEREVERKGYEVGEGGEKRMELLDCAHVFRRGSRVRVMVAGGSHPRYLRNLGTGEDYARSGEMREAVHTVRHCAGAESRVVLPVTEVKVEAVE